MSQSVGYFQAYPFALQLITWVLVFGGWGINIWNNKRQATRKETYDKLTSIVGRVEAIQSGALEFFSEKLDRKSWQKQRLKLSQELVMAALLVESLHLECKEDVLSAFSDFQDSIKMEGYFDDKQRFPAYEERELILSQIVLYSRDFIITLQEAFQHKYPHA